MTAPDYIFPIVACRVWQLDQTGLRSLNGEPWLPRTAFVAGCQASAMGRKVGPAAAPHWPHDSPVAHCTCGIYAAASVAHLRHAGYDQYGIHGEVYLWGTIVEHESGWRAEFAYPKSLVLPLKMLPRGMGRVETWLQRLTEYGCDISILGKEGLAPLWAKGFGYNAAGIDRLIERCQTWYGRRVQERRIKCGDRLAVRGRGIALVERLDGDCVYALLWNRSIVRIERNHIVWDVGNRRWEASRIGVSKSRR